MDNIELQFPGNVLTSSMDLGDVDNDGVSVEIEKCDDLGCCVHLSIIHYGIVNTRYTLARMHKPNEVIVSGKKRFSLG